MAPCTLCNDLKKKSEADTRLAFDFVPSEFLDSARTACPACNVILAGIRHSEDKWKLEKDVTRVYVFGLAKKEDSLSLELFFQDDRPKVVLEFYCTAKKGLMSFGNDKWEAIKPRSSPSGHPLSKAGMKWVSTRLDICKTKHSACQSRASTRLPTRTLSFRISRDGEADVKMVKNQNQFGRYTTLSHCWGSSQHCVLNSETISQFKKSIPWTQLPKTFQDAIIFSAKLGINHIWIDALCIVQDDPHDWEKESAKMADIYQNSFLTLAATASSDGMGGLFADDKSVVLSEHEFPGLSSFTGSERISVRNKLQHWEWPPSKASIKLCPLLSRGWVFQELILSPRVLQFCKDELLWECNEKSICECGSLPVLPETGKQTYIPRTESATHSAARSHVFDKIKTAMLRGLDKDMQRGNLPQAAAHIFHFEHWHHNEGHTPYQEEISNLYNPEKLDAAENWHRAVEQYSSLNLTKQNDRLPALSGLAIRSSPALGDYIAGLWNKSLLNDMLWRVNKLEHDIVKPIEYIAPSWSWASVTGPVNFWPELDTRLIEGAQGERLWFKARSDLVKMANDSKFVPVVDASLLNPYGKASSGTLHVHGYLQPAKLQYVFTRVGSTGSHTSAQVEAVPLKYELQIIGRNETLGWTPSIDLSFFADYVLQAEGPLQIPDNGRLYLLLIHPYMCLVLRSVDEEAKTFRRIGIIRQPVALVSEYGFNWMQDSVESDIQII